MACRAILSALLVVGCAAPAHAPAPTPDSTPAPEPPVELDPRTVAVWDFLRTKYDGDHDGVIRRDEYGRDERAFGHLDADRDGRLTRADFARQWDGVPRTADGRFVYGEGAPMVGEPAPDFALPDLDGQLRTLAELRAERPLVLVFGSYT